MFGGGTERDNKDTELESQSESVLKGSTTERSGEAQEAVVRKGLEEIQRIIQEAALNTTSTMRTTSEVEGTTTTFQTHSNHETAADNGGAHEDEYSALFVAGAMLGIVREQQQLKELHTS